MICDGDGFTIRQGDFQVTPCILREGDIRKVNVGEDKLVINIGFPAAVINPVRAIASAIEKSVCAITGKNLIITKSSIYTR